MAIDVSQLVELKRRVDAHNQKAAVQQTLYTMALEKLADRGFTPDSLQVRIEELEQEASVLERALIPELASIEDALG